MAKGSGKLLIGFSIMERMAKGLDGVSSEVKRFNDILEGISTEIARYNDLQASRRSERMKGKEKTRLIAYAEGTRARKEVAAVGGEPLPAPAKKEKAELVSRHKEKGAPKHPPTIPEALFKSIMAISKRRQQFAPSDVIARASKSMRGAAKKDSLRTALQGFKVGSKTADRLQPGYRDLIVPVKKEKGIYQLNPDKVKAK